MAKQVAKSKTSPKYCADCGFKVRGMHSIKLDIIDNDEHVPIEDMCKTLGLTCRKTEVYAGGGWPEYEFIGTREALLEMIGSWYATCQEDFCEFVTLIKKVED